MSLLYSNDNITINGYILDTTWKVISKYVTSILMATISNSSLPIAFAFGKGENIDLYSKLLNTTSEKLNLNFEGKVLESDQGKSLHSICKTFKMVHLSCLRHFIVSIKKMDYSFEAITLIKCTSQQDLESEKSLFTNKFKKFCTENSGELKKINKVLKKIGLLYINDQIIIQNQSRCDEVSMLQRRLCKMPSTTNTLESTHGQINRKTPRRNTFYSPLFRTFLCLNSKFESINKKLCHNYNYTRIKTLRQKQSLNNEEMINQCLFYQTTKDNCSCGQNKLESELYNIDIPCIHRLFNGASFKDLSQLSLNLEYQFNELLIDHEFVSEDEIQKTSFDDKTYAIRTIKQFSGFKDDKKISEYVNMYYNQEADGFYINNMEVQLIQLIEEGIFYFKQLKESIDIEKVDE
ncbi:hypothetical protein M9Y10_016837 [Tritrichomonas musculus]|uniref:MULE transposase domain-containing protein n=1 Tax=Tritrichomonas musculus TaxID=1915356 RepID=A0ABR2HYM8_9EUKA